MLYRLARPLLFRLDAERAHNLVFAGLAILEGLLARRAHAVRAATHPLLAQRLWDIDFPNPVGLAAGLDKDARLPHVWPLLGFGFAELGTITAVAQPGNPPPRIFRLPCDRALINRLGFNNGGATAAAQRLAHSQRRNRPVIPIGINIGKSRVTPLEDAAGDYLHSLRALYPYATYVTINVSSPNTPGLRDLQGEEHLAALLAVLHKENLAQAAARGQAPLPLLVKIAPDLPDEAFPSIVAAAQANGAAGFVATNTTIRRDGLQTFTNETGGLSGAPLRDRATAVIRALHRLSGPGMPIIGVGGIFSPEDAYAKIRAGASLVQVYTGLIFEGPELVHALTRGLVALLQRDGLGHLRDAVGKDA